MAGFLTIWKGHYATSVGINLGHDTIGGFNESGSICILLYGVAICMLGDTCPVRAQSVSVADALSTKMMVPSGFICFDCPPGCVSRTLPSTWRSTTKPSSKVVRWPPPVNWSTATARGTGDVGES
mmetsp:Transcript_61399/g.143635  ORF Transcript_61399/g.143635 Transcript_61399/m.143635 type:complete len:125 (-) Transcript_61399:1063-1437(-)